MEVDFKQLPNILDGVLCATQQSSCWLLLSVFTNQYFLLHYTFISISCTFNIVFEMHFVLFMLFKVIPYAFLTYIFHTFFFPLSIVTYLSWCFHIVYFLFFCFCFHAYFCSFMLLWPHCYRLLHNVEIGFSKKKKIDSLFLHWLSYFDAKKNGTVLEFLEIGQSFQKFTQLRLDTLVDSNRVFEWEKIKIRKWWTKLI